jgi:hypothetical protein
MIPLFPNFKKIDLGDKYEIDSFINKYSPYSDYNFVSLWSYNILDDVLISNLHNNLAVKFLDYKTNGHFYSFIGKNNINSTIAKLLRLAKEDNISPQLKLIPEESILSTNKLSNQYEIHEDRDNFDYILNLAQLKELPGSHYRTKRKSFKKFIKKNNTIHVEVLDAKERKLHEQILNTFYTWEKHKKFTRSETQHELLALNRLLKNADAFNLFITGIYMGKNLVGFLINELVHNDHAIGHFLKVDPSLEGIYDFLYSKNAELLLMQGCKFFNIEQDMGLEGLRTSKLLWHPSHFLKKYTISKNKLYRPAHPDVTNFVFGNKA